MSGPDLDRLVARALGHDDTPLRDAGERAVADELEQAAAALHLAFLGREATPLPETVARRARESADDFLRRGASNDESATNT